MVSRSSSFHSIGSQVARLSRGMGHREILDLAYNAGSGSLPSRAFMPIAYFGEDWTLAS